MTCVLVGLSRSHPGVDVTNACCESVHGYGGVTDGNADINLTIIRELSSGPELYGTYYCQTS